eukprot:403372502
MASNLQKYLSNGKPTAGQANSYNNAQSGQKPDKKKSLGKVYLKSALLTKNTSQTRLNLKTREQKTSQPHQRQKSINFSNLNSFQNVQGLMKNKSQNRIGNSKGRDRSFTPTRFTEQQQQSATSFPQRKSMIAQPNTTQQLKKSLNEDYSSVSHNNNENGSLLLNLRNQNNDSDDQDSGIQILQTKESIERRTNTGFMSNPQSSSNKKPSLRTIMKSANQLEQQFSSVASKYMNQQLNPSKRSSEILIPGSHSRRMTVTSNNSAYQSVRSKIYDHLQPPREISPVEKRDVLEQFIQPQNLVGLKAIKNEIEAKCEEREQLQNLIRDLQLKLKDTSKQHEGLEKGNKLVHKEFSKLSYNNEKSRDEIKSQVLLQRKQIEVVKKKLDIQSKKQNDFKKGTNESIMAMSQVLMSTTSKGTISSKFTTNKNFFSQPK